MKNIKKSINIASKKENAELVIKNAKIVNVFTDEIINGDIAIDNGVIVGIGEYKGREEIDINGKFLAPGLIDSHVHIESSMVSPSEFAKTIIPKGTTTIIADPHEIGNVLGIDGINYILDESEKSPLDTFVMLPSCVPVTNFENSGAKLEAKDLELLIKNDKVLGLGELMDFNGLLNLNENVLSKIEMVKKYNKLIDGHAPIISGAELNAYIGTGIKTEHECESVDEMVERLRLGMYVLIREGSAARNLKKLIKGVTKENIRRVLFCTDDRNPSDILSEGHIDNNVRLAIKEGLDPISAIKIATLNPAECYKLNDRGAVAPGYKADLIIFDTLEDFNIEMVIKSGRIVSNNSKALFDLEMDVPSNVKNTINFKEIKESDLEIELDSGVAKVIKLTPHSLVTESVTRIVDLEENKFKYNDKLDILKLAVIERHNNSGNIGLGLVEGFGLKDGAIASTIAHDSHNLIIIGDKDENIVLASEEIKRIGGGLVIIKNGKVLKSLPMPIAGIMSDKNLKEVNLLLEDMLNISYKEMKISKSFDPFMTLAFLALPVIPEIKLTDKGLFDVREFKFISING